MKTFLISLFLLFSASVFSQDENGTILKKNDPIPDFQLTSAKYDTVSSADLKGKVTLITIFTTWCGPCQRELAEIESVL